MQILNFFQSFVVFFILFIFVIAKRYGIKNEVKLFSCEPNARKMTGMFAFRCIFGLLTKAAAALKSDVHRLTQKI